ncbi:MAG: hypothetical protein RIB78_06365 [Gammaproteobacteria bacterium]
MTTTQVRMKVAPDPTLRVAEATEVPHEPLLASEPFAILGGDRQPAMASVGVSPDQVSCFGPRAASLINKDGPLWISDTGHHRLLGWKTVPESDRIPADWIIGQVDFGKEGRNAKGDVAANTLNVPTGICAIGEGMAVADAWNHRVLIWKTLPTDNNVQADLVLGQDNFHFNEANRGETLKASAHSFHWPYGIAWKDDHLFVADAENRRVLIWKGMPEENGQPADIVLGQKDFTCRDENAGDEPGNMSMRWPHAITVWRNHVCISDAGNNRIMIWKGIPTDNGAPCDYVLGQENMDIVDHNRSLYWPRANSVNMPYAIDSAGDWLLTADTANSRLIGWHIDDLATGANARALTGQHNFHDKGDNRWQPACADSLCWPYGIQVTGDIVVVSDSGNNRVSLWKLAV